ncbi:hypothetical protein JCM3770_005668 [Rhodotorula araucariae]
MAVDHLARLPVELFLDICEEVHVCCPRQYLGRVSKAFLPVAREHVFTNLRVVSYKSLARLVQAINASPGAGAYVKTLHITDASHRPRDGPLARNFATFLSHLPHLEEVKIDSVLFAQRLHRAIRHLPALRQVWVDHPFDGPDTATLVKLVKMATAGSIDSVTVKLKSFGVRVFTWRPPFRLYLTLEGDLAGSADLPNLLASTPPLHSLRLEISVPCPSGSLSTLLQSVAHPSALSSLTLRQHGSLSDDLSAVLPRFASLGMLELGAGISTATLLPALSVLPLLFELSFTHHAPLTDTHLLALINAMASAKLHKFRLALYIVLPVKLFWCDEDEDADAEVKGWTEEFTLAGMVDVVAAADKAGVNIHGRAVARARQEQERRRRVRA